MNKRPAYQWYPADADSDEVFKLMTYEQEGIYRRLLDHQWIEGSIPSDVESLARLLPKVPRDRFLEIWPLISSKFRPRNSDRLVNDKLESQRRKLDKFVQSQKVKSRKGVAARKLQTKNRQPVGQSVDKSTGLPDSNAGLTSSIPFPSPTKNKNLPPPRETTAPIIAPGAHRAHAICGKVCLPAALMESFKGRMGHLGETEALAYISRFYADWNTRYTSGDRAGTIVGEDAFDFWRARWAESHPTAPKNGTRTSGKFLADVPDDIAVIQPKGAAS